MRCRMLVFGCFLMFYHEKSLFADRSVICCFTLNIMEAGQFTFATGCRSRSCFLGALNIDTICLLFLSRCILLTRMSFCKFTFYLLCVLPILYILELHCTSWNAKFGPMINLLGYVSSAPSVKGSLLTLEREMAFLCFFRKGFIPLWTTLTLYQSESTMSQIKY